MRQKKLICELKSVYIRCSNTVRDYLVVMYIGFWWCMWDICDVWCLAFEYISVCEEGGGIIRNQKLVARTIYILIVEK